MVVTHWVHPDVHDRLAEFCRPVVPSREQAVWSRAQVLPRAREAEGLVVCMADRVDAELLAACPRVRVVSGVLKGHNTIDVGACASRGVQVTVVPESLTAPTAELAVALMLALRRRLVEGDAWVRAGRHIGLRPQFFGSGLARATVGIVGMGELGQAVAKRVLGFDAQVVSSDPRPLPEDAERGLTARRVPLGKLLAASDVVVPLVPLTETTRHLLDTETLSQLLAHPRTVFTPHLGSAVDDVRRATGLVAAEQVRQALAGQRPEGTITPPAVPTTVTGQAPE